MLKLCIILVLMPNEIEIDIFNATEYGMITRTRTKMAKYLHSHIIRCGVIASADGRCCCSSMKWNWTENEGEWVDPRAPEASTIGHSFVSGQKLFHHRSVLCALWLILSHSATYPYTRGSAIQFPVCGAHHYECVVLKREPNPGTGVGRFNYVGVKLPGI